MGWLATLWAKIVGWISGFIRGAISLISMWIDEMRVQIALFKYNLQMRIAGWLEDDNATILLTFALVTVAIFAWIIGSMPAFGKLLIWFRNTREEFKNRMQSIEDIIGFQVALSVHNVSLIMFPEYQKIIGDLRVSVSAFMSVIGEPIRTATLLLESSRALVYSSYALAGFPDDYKEAAWLSGVETWLLQADQRIRRYTLNPELIFQDIWLEVVQPNLEPANEAIATIYSTLNDLSNKAIEFTGNLDNFRDAYKNFTGALPDEIREAVETRLLPITQKLDWILDEKLIPFTEKTGAAFDVINQMIVDNENKIVVLIEKIDDPLYLLELIDKLSGTRRETALQLLYLLNLELEADINQKVGIIQTQKFNDYKKDLFLQLQIPMIDGIIPVERSDISVRVWDIKYSKDSWFVGEY